MDGVLETIERLLAVGVDARNEKEERTQRVERFGFEVCIFVDTAEERTLASLRRLSGYQFGKKPY